MATGNPDLTQHQPRRISFSGYEWEVKSGKGMKPGPNDWSDSADSVWTDEQKELHLRLVQLENKWYATEVTMIQPLGYGTYVFYIDSRIDVLDRNLVLGLFAYENDANEIDIEFAHWGNPLSPNSQYVVQPGKLPGHAHWFSTELDSNRSTHGFIWAKDFISFRSVLGHDSILRDSNAFAEWEYLGPIPKPGAAKIHINMWLFKGMAPSDRSGAEIIVKGFEFVPE